MIKTVKAFSAESLADELNKLNIKAESIVQIVRRGTQWVCFYSTR